MRRLQVCGQPGVLPDVEVVLTDALGGGSVLATSASFGAVFSVQGVALSLTQPAGWGCTVNDYPAGMSAGGMGVVVPRGNCK